MATDFSKSIWTPHGEVSVPNPVIEQARKASRALKLGQAGDADTTDEIREMRLNRRANLQKQADLGGGVSSAQVSFATGRSRDPMFYWKQSNLPFEYEKENQLLQLRKYSKLLYLTHPVIASCIDIFSNWPLTGMHFGTCKDQDIVEFYEELFFDGLNYEEYLPSVAHEYWTLGEGISYGQFNPTMGIWEDEELINPDDVKVIRSPFLREPRFEMRVPETIREIIAKREPEWEYRQLVNAYPELVRYAQQEEFMPVSNVLMKQVAFKPDNFFHRGLPILMRAFRSVYQEEMLNAALDSIASRLYTPLVLVRLGATATDMGTDVAWVPDATDLQNFEMALDTALAADFRVLTSHFATQIDSVFGRENVPDFGPDFDRLIDRQLLCFGISRTMLMGASSGETYAADALNRDLIQILLLKMRRLINRLYISRAKVVAEAQQHYDFETRAGKRYPIMQEILVVDNQGNKKIVEKPKLLYPKLEYDVMNLQNETEMRQFVEALRQSGVPISMRTRMQNIGVDLESEYEAVREEQKRMAMETQQTRKEVYLALKAEGLPIDQQLLDDFEPHSEISPEPAEPQMPFANEAIDPATDSSSFVPIAEDYQQADQERQAEAEQGIDPNAPPATPVLVPGVIPQAHRPPESDEMRKNMPRASSRHSPLIDQSRGFRHDASNENGNGNGHINGQANSNDPTRNVYVVLDNLANEGAYRLMSGPTFAPPRLAADGSLPTPGYNEDLDDNDDVSADDENLLTQI